MDPSIGSKLDQIWLLFLCIVGGLKPYADASLTDFHNNQSRSLIPCSPERNPNLRRSPQKKDGHRPSSLNDELKQKLIEAINADGTTCIEGTMEKLYRLIHTTTSLQPSYDADSRKEEERETTNHLIPENRRQNITMILSLDCKNIIGADPAISTGVISAIFK
ncbi:hypothetical protein RF11_16191 [Thelohanellus kitauei]|uniref:Uncharacterized protein n=1 Tax=Thelohanellus kitauei TaxID=669202 RepID=A0A0C2N4J7_THEKT|nr:hypothetical protein RF11_16191 [Thelohanellus kitauei]